MKRYWWSGLCAVALIGALGACGTEAAQKDEEGRLAAAKVAPSEPGNGNGATVLFDAFPYNVNMNVSRNALEDGDHLAILETSDPDYGRTFWCPTFPPANPDWPYGVEGFPSGWLAMKSHDTITPSAQGKYNAWSKGPQYITIFKHHGPVPDPQSSPEFWCDVIRSPIVAWGVAEFQLKLHWDNAEQTWITQAGKGILTAPGCPSAKARFAVYGPISFTSVFGDLDFACTKH